MTYTVSPNRKIHLTPGIKKIRNAQYFGCDMAGHLIIPSSVIEIGNFAFCCCSKLKSVTIPKSVQTIGISAFAGCRSMKKISIADEVSYIWSNAFEDCTSLREIRLPASLIDIGTGMFHNCSSLKSVTITNPKTLIIDNQVNARAALRNKMFENILLGREISQNHKDSIMEIKFCYQEMQDMTIFRDCRSLRKIYVPRDYSHDAMAKILQGNDMSVETARKISVAVGYNFLQEMGYNVTEEILKAEQRY